MNQKIDVNYSPELDILSVDDTDRKYNRSVTLGDFVIDLDPEGKVRGAEIQNVSKLLGIDREQLKDISEVELVTDTDSGNLQLTLRIQIDQRKTTLAAQLQKPETSKA